MKSFEPVSLSIVVTNARAIPWTLLSTLSSQLLNDDELVLSRDVPPSSSARWFLTGGGADSHDIGEEIGSLPPQVKIVTMKENGGAAAVRNAGASIAKGSWLLFLDDDVEVSPQFLASVRCAIEASQSRHVVTFRIASTRDEGHNSLLDLVSLDRGDTIRHSTQPLQLRDVWELGAGAAMAVTRDLFNGLGGFKEHLGAGRECGGSEDLEFLWHASHHTQIIYRGDISVRHPLPKNLHELGCKLQQYGKALGNLAGCAGGTAGMLMVLDYCTFLIESVRHHRGATDPVDVGRLPFIGKLINAFSGTIVSFVRARFLSLVGTRKVLCDGCA